MNYDFGGEEFKSQLKQKSNEIGERLSNTIIDSPEVTGGQVPRHRFLVTCEAADETLWKIASGREVYLSKSETPLQAVCGLFQTE